MTKIEWELFQEPDTNGVILRTPPVSSPVFWDMETSLITRANLAPPPVCIQFDDPESRTWTRNVWGGNTEDLMTGYGMLFEYLEQGRTIIAHNGFFDWCVVLNSLDWQLDAVRAVFQAFARGQIRDTSIRAKLHSISLGMLDQHRFGLDSLVDRYLGQTVTGKKAAEGEEDPWRLRYAELWGTPVEEWPGEAYKYASLDPVWVRRVWDCMDKMSLEFPDESFQTYKAWCLHLASWWGFTIDNEAAQTLADKVGPPVEAAMLELVKSGIYREEVGIDQEALDAWLGTDWPRTPAGRPKATAALVKQFGKDPRNPPEHCYKVTKVTKNTGRIKDLLVEAAAATEEGEGQLERTATGDIKADRKTLSRWVDAVPEFKPLIEVGALQKLQSTYIPDLVKYPRAHPRNNPLVATGRTSCSKPNLNNVPKFPGVRECYVAREGYVLCAADYAQAELCSFGQVCLDLFGYSEMAKAINEGKDLHLLLAATVFGEPYEELVRRRKEGDKQVGQQRQWMKAPNFGFPGGLGAKNFTTFARDSYGIEGLDLETATEWRNGWLRTWPEANAYLQFIGRCTQQGTFDITQLRSGRVRGQVGYSDGANTLFQGLTADGAGYALIRFTEEAWCNPESPLWGARALVFVYDEILAEWPDKSPEDNTRTAKCLSALMEDCMRVFTPDVKAVVEPALMRAWSKNADAVYNEDGFLVPWEPKSS
jgi:hypothetical protein